MTLPPALAQRLPLQVATRRSALAVTQSGQTVAALAQYCGLPCELVPMSSTGDDHPERALDAFDTKGIFLDSLREALLDGRVDLAIHSFKDVPSEPTPGLAITAIPLRAEGRDVLVTCDGRPIRDLPEGAKVGTSSARRRAQLLAIRPDIEICPIRGNVPTRIGRIHTDLDAVILAGAGLERLQRGLPDTGQPGKNPAKDLADLAFVSVPIPVADMVPAPAQGILALEHRADDTDLIEALAGIHHEPSALSAQIERGILARMGGGCSLPLGVYADTDDPSLTTPGGAVVHGFLGSQDGKTTRLTLTYHPDTPIETWCDQAVTQLKTASTDPV